MYSLLRAKPPLRMRSAFALLLTVAPLLAQRSPTAPTLVRDLDPGKESRSGATAISNWNGGRALIHYVDPILGAGVFLITGRSLRLLVGFGRNGLRRPPKEIVTFGSSRWAFVSDRDLWTSDGTVAGTQRILRCPSPPDRLTPFGSDLLFIADNNSGSGRELMRTDGTVAGTRLVRDIAPGMASSAGALLPIATDRMAVLNGRAYFGASAIGSVDRQLWSTDGTALGTYEVSDLAPGASNGSPRYLCASGNRVFALTSETVPTLWVSNGTANGTKKVQQFNGVLAVEAVAMGVGIHTDSGLWISAGTPQSTARISTTVGATSAAIGSDGLGFWFVANTPTQGATIWYAGAGVGLRRLGQVPVGRLQVEPQITAAGGKALILPGNNEVWTADARSMSPLGRGGTPILQPSNILLSLFVSDDSVMISDRSQRGTQALYRRAQAGKSSAPFLSTEIDGVAVFQAVGTTGRRITYRSDGTAAGTFALTMKLGGAIPGGTHYAPVRAGSWIYWKVHGSSGRVVLRTRGQRQDIEPVFSASGEPLTLRVHENRLYVLRSLNSQQNPVWRIDDQSGRATKILERPYYVDDVIHFGDALHWLERRPSGKHWMRLRNGTTTIVRAFASSGNAHFKCTDSHLFASIQGSLYAIDGNSGMPIRLGDTSSPLGSLATSNHLYFAGSDSLSGEEPWVSDGTRAGTRRLGDLNPGALSSAPHFWCRIGSRLAFNATTPTGKRLFFTDGSPTGTQPVGLPTQPLQVESGPFAVGSRHALFAAQTAGGVELVRTDGTPTGTRVVPSSASIQPISAVLSNGQVLLSFHRLQEGTELNSLWPGATAQTTGQPCAGAGRNPRLTADDPVLGGALSVTATNLHSGSGRNGVLVMMPPIHRPTPLLGTRCLAHGDWTRLAVLSSFPVTRSDWSFQAQLPNLPALDRLQAILRVVAAPTDGPLFGDLTNAIRLSFGD